MSKGNNGGDFQNKAARKFRQQDDIAVMGQRVIFRTLEDDIDVILDQVIRNQNMQGKFPAYILNAFANLSTAKWFYDYVCDHVKVSKKNKVKSDLEDQKLDALKDILARAYKKSVTNFYANQAQDFVFRNQYISKAFIMLDPMNYALTKTLNHNSVKLPRNQRRDLCIQVYGDPIYNIKFVASIFDSSNISDKKKLKLLKALYQDRFVPAVGAAMTMTSTKSDFLSMCYEYIMVKLRCKKKRKTLKNRAPFIQAYAYAYKRNQTSYFKLKGGEFYEENKSLFKELYRDVDIGYRKASTGLKPKKDRK